MRNSAILGLALSAALGAAGCAGPGFSAPPGIVMTPSVKSMGIHPSQTKIAYGNRSSSQHLDLYLPSGQGLFPVVVYIHGGGFKFGDRQMISAALVKGYLDAGYAVASLDYRLSGEAPFPAAAQDVLQAIGFIKQNSQGLQINQHEVVVFGESAGANLAALAGTAYNDKILRANVDNPDINLKPMAVIAHYPPVDFLQIDPMLAAQGCPAGQLHDSANSFESAYMGAALPTIPDKVKQSNPASYISASSAPFFIQNGDADCNVGAGQSMLLVSALQAAQIPVTYERIPGASHGGPAFETPDNIQKILAFLQPLLSPH